MGHPLVTHTQPLARLNKGLLAKHLARYQAFLEERRYAPGTRHNYLCCVAHFVHWMASTELSAGQFGEGAVNRFLCEHLPRCRCPRPARRAHQVNRGALRLFLKALRVGGQIEPCEASDHISRELRRFDLFMTEVRGLAVSTRQMRLGLIRSFLRHQFGSKPILVRQVKPADLRRYLFVRHQALSAAGLKSIAEALRGYIRFRATLGDPVQHLTFAAPTVANRRLSPPRVSLSAPTLAP